MALRKKSNWKLIWMPVLCLLLCACGAPLLSQREVVRGVFFFKEPQGYTAVLLLADQNPPEDGEEAYRTAKGRSSAPDAALRAAEETLEGTVFYGLTDLCVLPAGADWEELIALGELLYRRAQPAPRITLYALSTGEIPLEEQAQELYRAMHNAQRRYGIQNGLPVLFSQPTECALPVWQGTGYGFGFWQQGRPAAQYTDELAAQLAAVLCGQADRLDAGYADGQAEVEAVASVRCQVDNTGQATLRLSLRSARVWDLSGEGKSDQQLFEMLYAELEQDFTHLAAHVQTGGFDPLRVSVWQFARTGKTGGLPRFVVKVEK